MPSKTIWPFVVATICVVLAVIFTLALGFGLNLFQSPPSIPKAAYTAPQCINGCNVSGVLPDITAKPLQYAILTQSPFNVTVSTSDPSLYGQVCITQDGGNLCSNFNNATFSICCAISIGIQRSFNATAETFSITFTTKQIGQEVCFGCPQSTTVEWVAFALVVSFLTLFAVIFCCIGCCCLAKKDPVARH